MHANGPSIIGNHHDQEISLDQANVASDRSVEVTGVKRSFWSSLHLPSPTTAKVLIGILLLGGGGLLHTTRMPRSKKVEPASILTQVVGGILGATPAEAAESERPSSTSRATTAASSSISGEKQIGSIPAPRNTDSLAGEVEARYKRMRRFYGFALG